MLRFLSTVAASGVSCIDRDFEQIFKPKALVVLLLTC